MSLSAGVTGVQSGHHADAKYSPKTLEEERDDVSEENPVVNMVLKMSY